MEKPILILKFPKPKEISNKKMKNEMWVINGFFTL